MHSFFRVVKVLVQFKIIVYKTGKSITKKKFSAHKIIVYVICEVATENATFCDIARDLFFIDTHGNVFQGLHSGM